jgi:peptidyl-prolyl cis-trans isomerase D
MISWIQRYFQHHFKLVFGTLLLIMAVPLVWVFNPSSGVGRGDQRTIERHFFGYNLGSQEDQAKLIGDASLSAQLQGDYYTLQSEQQLQSVAFQRVATLAIADQLHVPATSKAEIADYIKTLRIFSGDDGQFDAKRYTTFRDSLKTNPRMTEATVSRVLGDDVRSEKVQKLISGPGYVLPADVTAQLDRADSLWTLGVATVDYASFKPAVATSDADLAKFFAENSFRYEIAPRIVVNHADFSALNYLGSVAVTDGEVRAYYDANPDRFPKPAADPKAPVPPKADPAADFAAVRAQVESSLKLDRARRLAAKAASDLSYALYEGKITPATPAFDQLLAAQNVTLKPLAPFTRNESPAELGGSPEIATEAFKLGANRAYSDAVTTPTGAVVLFFKELLPSRKPLLAEVREKVSADYVEGEKRKRFVELGRTLRALLENRLKAGDTFEKAVAAAAATGSTIKIEGKMLAPFTRRQPPQDVDQSIAGVIERLEKGRVSDMIISSDKGLLVYAADKKSPDLSETSPQFAAMREQIAQVNARMSAATYIGEIVEQELKKSEPAVK